MARLVKSGKVRDLPPRVISALVFGPTQALCLDWLRGGSDVDPSACEDTLVEAACAALRAPVTAPVKVAPRVKPPRPGEETDLTVPDLFSRP
jgi:hypothetical protein